MRGGQAAIARLAYDSLHVTGDGIACRVDPVRQQVAKRTDGTYAALFSGMTCKGRPRELTLDYRLFFAVDPSHRGILVFRGRGNVPTTLLSPAASRVTLGR